MDVCIFSQPLVIIVIRAACINMTKQTFLCQPPHVQVDAGFISIVALESFGDQLDIVQGDEGITCAEGGSSMMGRKDNPFFQWFSPALEELLASPEYREICDNLVSEHGMCTLIFFWQYRVSRLILTDSDPRNMILPILLGGTKNK